MQTNLRIGDKVRNDYNNRNGVVVSVEPDVTAHYDLASKRIVKTVLTDTLVVKVLCDVRTLDTQQPCTEYLSFLAVDLVLVN